MKNKNQFLTRQSKIDFLHAVWSGKQSISDILPVHAEFWRSYVGHNENSFTNEETGETLTRDQLEIRKRNTGKNIIWLEILTR